MGNSAWSVAFEDATKEDENFVFGKISVTSDFVIVKKGSPKRAWVEGVDAVGDRSTELTLIVDPLVETGLTKFIKRTVLAKKWSEWGTIVFPSLVACGVTEETPIDGKFVKVETVKNGSTYKDQTTGEIKERTTFKFLAIYDTYEVCLAAYQGSAEQSSEPNDAGAIDMSAGAGASVVNPEKDTAKKFLEALVKQSNGNETMLKQMLSNMPMITKYYPVGSPEYTQMLAIAA